MLVLPNIIEKTGRSTKLIDIPSKLYEDDIITLFGEVSEESSYLIITQLLYLDSLKTDDPVNLYINSPGGSVYAGLAIHDVIKNMRRKVNTICIGMAASMGAFLLFSGTGVRKSLPNSRIMIHSVSSGMGGTVHDMRIDLKETEYLQDKLMKMQVEYSKGKLYLEDMIQLTERDKYMTPEETLKLGLIDDIIN